jgi:hypothetical protein
MIKIVELRLTRADLRTRMPFRYGIATMTHLPHVFLRVKVAIDGRIQEGISAEHLPPKWFTKDPARSLEDEIVEMLRVAHHAMSVADGAEGPDVFTLWRNIYEGQSAWARAEGLAPLLGNFGSALVERALIDAFARYHRTPFHQLLRTNRLGWQAATFHPELRNSHTADWLQAAPPEKVFARHTVGLTDPLTAEEIPASERVDDGLPQSLDQCIGAYQLRHFKLKIRGDVAADLDRLEAIAAVLAKHAADNYRFSLDGNESFAGVEVFREFLNSAGTRPALKEFLGHMLFVEQPFHRKLALSDEVGDLLQRWPDRPPIIIDESDAEIGSLGRALELGYAGTSHKNCKGVFKGVANACRLEQLRREHPEKIFLMSGEDLSNIGPIALLQDLAVQAAIGVRSVERNGHHYFAGLSFWPVEWQSAMLEHHGDLYKRSERGWPTVNVSDGEVALGSVHAAPFGVSFLPTETATMVDA